MVGKRWMLMGNYFGGDEAEMGMSGGMGMRMGERNSFRDLFDLTATQMPRGKWSFTHNVGVGFQSGDAWYGLSSQARYELNPHQGFTLRGEIFRDDGGMMSGSDQTLTSITAGYTHTLDKYAQLRAEYRRDFSGGARPFAANRRGGFSAGQGTFILAAIVSY